MANECRNKFSIENLFEIRLAAEIGRYLVRSLPFSHFHYDMVLGVRRSEYVRLNIMLLYRYRGSGGSLTDEGSIANYSIMVSTLWN